MTGMIVLDDKGDREPDYWISDMVPNGTFVKIAEILNIEGGGRVSNSLTITYFSGDTFVVNSIIQIITFDKKNRHKIAHWFMT